MTDPGPTRTQSDLAEMLETLLDKGVIVNADIAVTVGDTELLGVQVRAAIASFETAAKYGLEFPGGTDMDRVAAAADVDPIEDDTPTATPVDGDAASGSAIESAAAETETASDTPSASADDTVASTAGQGATDTDTDVDAEDASMADTRDGSGDDLGTQSE